MRAQRSIDSSSPSARIMFLRNLSRSLGGSDARPARSEPLRANRLYVFFEELGESFNGFLGATAGVIHTSFPVSYGGDRILDAI